MFNITVITYSVIAAIIGAGFASGQEILLYFVTFGKFGILGIILTAALSVFFVYAVLDLTQKYNYKTYDDFLTIFKSAALRRCIKFVTLLFSFAVYGAMLSAAGEIIFELFNVPYALSTLLCAVCAVIMFSVAGERIFTLNGILGTVLVVLIVFSVLYMLSYREFHVFSTNAVKAVSDGFIYSGYNLVSLTPVLVILAKRTKKHRETISVSLCVGISVAVIMGLMFYLLSIYEGKINLGELPMLTLAKRQSNSFALFYAFVLFCAVLTTLISSGGGLIDILAKKNKPFCTVSITAFAYFFSSFGFSNLINTAYRFCGIGGIFVCTATLLTYLKKGKK